MNKRLFVFFAVAVFISSCGKPNGAPPASAPSSTSFLTSASKMSPTETPLPTVKPACVSPKPTQKDIDRALAYTGETFNASEWARNYTASETNVAVTWQNAAQSATVYLEAIIFSCGYEELDLNKYFSAEYWKAIFANYESYKTIVECKTDTGLRLYQFKTQNQGFEYRINYWVQSDTDTRVIATMLVFPAEAQATLGDYSARLFPKLPNCS
jgi:hypothetical protein